MAIRNPTSQDNVTVTVYLRGATKARYFRCDLPAQPWAIQGTFSFWDDEKLITLPLDTITSVEMNFNE